MKLKTARFVIKKCFVTKFENPVFVQTMNISKGKRIKKNLSIVNNYEQKKWSKKSIGTSKG